MRPAWLAILFLATPSCAPTPPVATPLGAAERSWNRALHAARQAGWSYARIGAMRVMVEHSQPDTAPRFLCDILYDLADNRVTVEEALRVLAASAEALQEGTTGDPLAAAIQLGARAGYPGDVLVQTAQVLAEAQAHQANPEDLVRVLDRAVVFRTPAWTALQFLKDIVASADTVPAQAQVDLFEEALGRKGRHLEAQAVLKAYREAVTDGLPPGDLSSACRRKLRTGLPPSALPAYLKEVIRWPVPPLSRPDALRLIGTALAHALPDDEVASLGGFIARSTMDARDATILAGQLEDGIRRGLKGKALLSQVLENFSGARPSEPLPR
jgi:hypothetical protein